MDFTMRPTIFILIIALFGLQYKLWFSDGNIFQWRKLEQHLNKKQHNNAALNVRNRAIEAEITSLRAGDDALEEEARFNIGMVKKGEVFYQFTE